MKKSLVLQPKDFRQTFHFWMRRPDYGWSALWEGLPLEVEPFEQRLERISGARPRWVIRQKVKGMETTVYVDQRDLNPDGFTVYELPSESWWKNEGRDVVVDYFKFGTRNAPTAHVAFAAILVFTAFIFMIVKDPSGQLAFMSDQEIPHLARKLGLLAVITPFASIGINKILPSRTYLATQAFRAEAWLLLLTVLATLPAFPRGIKDFRAQVLAAAAAKAEASAPPALEEAPTEERDPASN